MEIIHAVISGVVSNGNIETQGFTTRPPPTKALLKTLKTMVLVTQHKTEGWIWGHKVNVDVSN